MENKQLPKQKLSNTGFLASRVGYGAMGLSAFYGVPVSEEEGIRLIGLCLEQGQNFFDTAHIYGDNEILLGKAMKHYGREKFFLATKVPSMELKKQGELIQRVPVPATAENIKKFCDISLERLQTNYIDLYYQHRIDQTIPIEKQAQAYKELIQEGKVKYYGLSEASEDSIRRAHAVHPLTAVQEEYSLQTRDIETNGVLKTCKELNIALVAYSPLGRGLLSGTIQDSKFETDDFRNLCPRYQDEALKKNNERVQKLKEIADSLNATPSQVAIAWVLAQGDFIFPIPGSKQEKYITQNNQAAHIVLSEEILKKLDELFPIGSTEGGRYPDMFMKSCNATTVKLE